ncbi:MAG: condensation domain-containing protein, partial [Cyanobacteriota bacterium]|nr:condensation domain-containing protein [Cyanobacteriota bacterium]
MKDINQRIANLSPAERALLEQQLQKKANTLEFLSQLRNSGIQISTDGEKLRCNAPKDALTPSLRAELAERKAEIIALLQNTNLTENSTQSTIQRTPRNQDLPLTFAQQRLWFLDQLEPNSPFYNIAKAVRLNGDLNIQVLQQALDAIVVHHEILLTNYISKNGTPIQVVAAPQSVELQIIDLQQYGEIERETQAKTILQQESQRPFNLESDMMLRGCLLQLAPEEYVLLLVVHHIASDGWSTGILWEQLTQLYKAFLEGKPNPLTKIPIQYADYAVWQREWLTGEVLEKQLNYWKQQLARANPVLELPKDNPRPPVQTYNGATTTLALPQSLNDKLQQLCRQEGVTLYMTLL